jgi:hypothetical protein
MKVGSHMRLKGSSMSGTEEKENGAITQATWVTTRENQTTAAMKNVNGAPKT